MSTQWMLFTLIVPPTAALVAGLAFRGKEARPELTILFNGLMPGSGLAAAGRPVIEVVLGVIYAMTCLLIAGGVRDLPSLLPFVAIGAGWTLLYTPFNPLTRETPPASASPLSPPVANAQRTHGTTQSQVPRPAPPQAAPQGAKQPVGPDEEAGYSVAVRCTECGADVEVPVLEHMAHCSYCGSDHLVVGHEETLYVTIPEKVSNATDLKNAILDHYRYQHYLKLYKSSVAPLEASATEASASGIMIQRPEVSAAAAAAEVAVSRKADLYRQRLAEELELGRSLHLVTPYRHGMGTLYQAAFGRNKRDQEKRLSFAVGTIEASAIATSKVELPKMGKLSYLRALRPAASLGATTAALPLDSEPEDLSAAYGNLDHKQLERDLQVIRLGSVFAEEVTAVVWRPWWIAEVKAPGIHDILLVDSAAASVASHAPTVTKDMIEGLPAEVRDPGRGLRFHPMECPTCGYEFRFDPSAVIHFCTNCHRVFDIHHKGKRELEYRHMPWSAAADADIVPFWQFPLRIRTGDGQLLTDLMHLKDGIDGTFDQIGEDSIAAQHAIYMPAVRFINSKLMAKAFGRLFIHTLRHPPHHEGRRYPLEDRPLPWTISLEESEARRFLPLYLANAFTKRDITRVNVHQVVSWLFEARQEAGARLVYLNVPRTITEPFRRYAGRFTSSAVQDATKKGVTINSEL